MRLFFDVNVILDVLARRNPWFEHSAAALSVVDVDEADGFVAAHTITTLNYLLTAAEDSEKAAAALVDLLGLVRAVSVGHDTLLKALALAWDDFEDAVQAVCAMEIDADYLVTRNPGDFQSLSIAVVSPGELLALLSNEEAERPESGSPVTGLE